MQPEPEVGTDSPSSARRVGQPLGRAAPPHRGDDAGAHAEHGGDHDRQQRQLDRHRQRGAQHRGDAGCRCGSRCPGRPAARCSRTARTARAATGPGRTAARIAASVSGRAVLAGQGQGRVAGQGPHAEEHHHRGQQQRQRRLPGAVEQVPAHGSTSPKPAKRDPDHAVREDLDALDRVGHAGQVALAVEVDQRVVLVQLRRRPARRGPCAGRGPGPRGPWSAARPSPGRCSRRRSGCRRCRRSW